MLAEDWEGTASGCVLEGPRGGEKSLRVLKEGLLLLNESQSHDRGAIGEKEPFSLGDSIRRKRGRR